MFFIGNICVGKLKLLVSPNTDDTFTTTDDIFANTDENTATTDDIFTNRDDIFATTDDISTASDDISITTDIFNTTHIFATPDGNTNDTLVSTE